MDHVCSKSLNLELLPLELLGLASRVSVAKMDKTVSFCGEYLLKVN